MKGQNLLSYCLEKQKGMLCQGKQKSNAQLALDVLYYYGCDKDMKDLNINSSKFRFLSHDKLVLLSFSIP